MAHFGTVCSRSSAAITDQSGTSANSGERSLLLIVPSVVARMAHNFLLNPEHPAFPRVTHGLHRPV